jgi:putative transposase
MNALYAALGISKQGFHQMLNRWLKKESLVKQVVHIVNGVRRDHPTMGVRDIYFKMQPGRIGRDVFEEICRQESLMSVRPKNWTKTTDSRGVRRFENLTKGLIVNKMDQLWQSDITYFEVSGRFYYLTFIQDMYTKTIVGHHVSASLATENTTLPALKKALQLRKGRNLEGLIFHSDGGGQYYCADFLAITHDVGIDNSMCENAWENGMVERLNGVIKNNYLKHRSITSFKQLVKEVDRIVSIYNHDKPHRALKRKTPYQFEMELLKLHQQQKPRKTESFDANCQLEGASSPSQLKQPKPQNRDIVSANYLEVVD